MKKHRQNEEGMALVLATVVVAVAVISLSALGMRAIKQSHNVDQYELYTDTHYGIESAVAASWVDLEENQGNGWIGLGTWTPAANAQALELPTWDSDGIAPVDLNGTNIDYMAYVNNWAANGLDDNGDGTIDEPAEAGLRTIYAFASNNGITRGTEVVVEAVGITIWDNAIFAGAGQAGGLINGNVSIHGSVHLLGDNLLVGNAALAAIDLSGTSLIHNNYVGLDAALEARIPALPITNFNGENIATIEAKLRVKNGLVGMSGNSEIGEPDVPGNGVKETMDGTFVNDGWTGNAVTADGDRGDPQAVSSDNGWDETYDLGNKLPMPYLVDDYRDPLTGATFINPGTGVNYTHEEYFTQVLTTTSYPGDMTIRANADFYFNATTGDTDPANRQPGEDYIYFERGSNVLEINGQIAINGDFTLDRGSGNDKTMHYTGRAAILANNVELAVNLYSRNSDGTTALSYPVNNCLGIMARGDMMVGQSSQLDIMGAFYSQGTTASQRQTTILGTIVGTYFDMGTNVPDIYQVPILKDNLPEGMIGSYPNNSYNQVSWREISL